LSFKENKIPCIRIIVVDNDCNKETEDICLEMGHWLRWPLKYVQESERGISQARNKTISLVPDDTDFIAFIDDDEEADPFWLDMLLTVQWKFNADVVTGKMLVKFENNPKNWMSADNLIEYRIFKRTGQRVMSARTGNSLICCDLIKKYGFRFNEKFSLTGGGDYDFFMRISMSGFKIVGASEAVVYAWMPKERSNLKWLWKRWFIWGILSVSANPHIYLKHSCYHIFLCGFGIFKWIGHGTLLIFKLLSMDRVAFARGISYIVFGLGRIAGFLGVSCEQYKVIEEE